MRWPGAARGLLRPLHGQAGLSRPEDRLDGEIDEADPEYGFFSPHSWWPLVLGFATFLVVLGLVFAVWVVVLGVAVLLLALVGWLFEYYRGDFAV